MSKAGSSYGWALRSPATTSSCVSFEESALCIVKMLQISGRPGSLFFSRCGSIRWWLGDEGNHGFVEAFGFGGQILIAADELGQLTAAGRKTGSQLGDGTGGCRR